MRGCSNHFEARRLKGPSLRQQEEESNLAGGQLPKDLRERGRYRIDIRVGGVRQQACPRVLQRIIVLKRNGLESGNPNPLGNLLSLEACIVELLFELSQDFRAAKKAPSFEPVFPLAANLGYRTSKKPLKEITERLPTRNWLCVLVSPVCLDAALFKTAILCAAQGASPARQRGPTSVERRLEGALRVRAPKT